MKLQKSDYDKLIDMALAEDLGDNGDVTTDSIFTEPSRSIIGLLRRKTAFCAERIFSAKCSLSWIRIVR